MLTYILSGIFLLSLIGWSVLVYKKLKLHPTFIPIFLFSVVTCVLFISGILNILTQVVYVIFLIGFFLLIYYTFQTFKQKEPLYWRYIATPGIFFFVLFGLFVVFHLKGIIYLHYDNFSHWALIIKEMFRIEGLPDHSTMVNYTTYPPGSAIFIYFVNKIIGYTESHTLMAQGLLIGANLSVLFAFSKWRRPVTIIIPLITSVVLISIITQSLHHLLVDTLLGLTALSISIISYYYKNDWQKLFISTAPLLIFLLLIKDSGKLFFILNVAVIIILMISNYYTKSEQDYPVKKPNVMVYFLISIVALPLFFNFLWGQYVDKAYVEETYESNKFEVSLSTITDIDKSPEFMNNIVPNIIEVATNIENPNVLLLILLNIFTLIMLFLIYLKNKKTDTLLFGTLLLTNVFYIIYVFSLFLMYVFLMPENEASRLAGFKRYQSTAIIYITGLLMLVNAYKISTLLTSFRDQVIKAPLLFIMCVMALFPFHDNTLKMFSKPEVESSLRYQVKELVSNVPSENFEDIEVAYYSPESKDDKGFLDKVLYYEQLSDNYSITTQLSSDEEVDEFENKLSKSDYLVIVNSNESLENYLKKYTDSVIQSGIFKIDNDGDSISIDAI
ncbi:hypothetical protein [Gracilibacillus suaedae]|uniref:hypothetical protein n=1 Tax=Gracilibacillus suaedae TaxID=2820273 RepID=UPI001ABE0923|nr:hypothetical protein [Gracilibacillus suaedae]